LLWSHVLWSFTGSMYTGGILLGQKPEWILYEHRGGSRLDVPLQLLFPVLGCDICYFPRDVDAWAADGPSDQVRLDPDFGPQLAVRGPIPSLITRAYANSHMIAQALQSSFVTPSSPL
jgi:hypothetical protein